MDNSRKPNNKLKNDKKNKTKIVIACHKKCRTPYENVYIPVHAGSANNDTIKDLIRDDSGDNISEKNPIYSELTVLYWAWKNLDCDYLGLVHYRRYFTLHSLSFRKRHHSLDCVLSSQQVRRLTSDSRVILPKKRDYYIESIYSHYAHTFDGAHLKAAGEIISDIYPEYRESFDTAMRLTNGYMFNMFIMEKALADDYCEWLFNILSVLETRIDTAGMTDFEKRYAGRVSECLFNVWLLYKIKKGIIKSSEIKEIPWFYIGRIDWKKKITSFVSAKFFDKKYKESF